MTANPLSNNKGYMPYSIELSLDALQLSEEQFVAFCRSNKDLRIERKSNGKIILMSPTFFSTGNVNAEVVAQLVVWNKQYKLGKVGESSTAYILPDTSMYVPDASWISNEKLAALPKDAIHQFLPACPNFVIEIKSHSDTLKSLQSKMTKVWIANGVELAWLIDPKMEMTHIYKADGTHTTVKGFDQNISGESVLPKFELVLADLREA